MKSLKRSWPVLVICCVLVFCAMSMLFGLGAVFTDIMDTFQVSRTTASLVHSLCIGLIFLNGTITGHFLLRRGPRVVVITGCVLTTAGCVIAFLATHIVQVIVGIGVFGGIGTSFYHLTSMTMTGVVFHDAKSLALTIYNISMALGSVVFPILLRHLTEVYSVRGTFMILAAIHCQLILCGALLGVFVPRIPGKTAVISEPRKETEAADEADEEEEEAANAAVETDTLSCTLTMSQVYHKEEHLTGDFHRDDSENIELFTQSRCNPGDHVEIRYESDVPGNKGSPENSLLPLNNVAGRNNAGEQDKSFRHQPVKLNNKRHLYCVHDCWCESLSKRRIASCLELGILRNVRFVVFAVFAPSSALYLFQPIIFMTDMAKAKQMTPEDGSFFLTVIFVGNVFGRLVAGVLYRLLRSGTLLVYAISLATGGVMCVFYLFIYEYAHFLAVSFLLGTSFGVLSANVPMVYLEIVGPGLYAVGLGYVATVDGVFHLLAGPYGGLVRDLTGTYEPVYYIACIHGLLIGFVLVFTALRYRHSA